MYHTTTLQHFHSVTLFHLTLNFTLFKDYDYIITSLALENRFRKGWVS